MKTGMMALCGIAAILTFGCADDSAMDGVPPVMSDSHDHGGGHDHAETLKEAVEELVGLRNAIRDGFAKDDADAAHGPLHSLEHVYGEIEEFAEADLEADQLNAVRDALETLKEALGSVDAMMHGDEGSEYSEVAEKVDAAVAVLVEASGADSAGHTHEDGHDEHGEEGHDHDEDGDHAEEHDAEDKDHADEHKDGDHDEEEK